MFLLNVIGICVNDLATSDYNLIRFVICKFPIREIYNNWLAIGEYIYIYIHNVNYLFKKKKINKLSRG